MARTKNASLRAAKSAGVKVVKTVKDPTRQATKRQAKVVGKGIRQNRRAAGKNPNTGKGSLERLALRRAKKTGLITKGQKRKAIKTLKSLNPSTRASYTKGPQYRGKGIRATGKSLSDTTRKIRRQRKASGRGKFGGKIK